MEQIRIDSHLYERIYNEIEDYGRADFNHCPAIRLYPHYSKYLANRIIDLGAGTGETVKFFRDNKLLADGIDWITPRNNFCKKGDITAKRDLSRYAVATCFDVVEHLNNHNVIQLFSNMVTCKRQIFTIANSESIITLESGVEIDLHINKKSFDIWRGVILDYFDIIREIPIREYHRLYICEQKKETEEYCEYLAKFLRNKGYKVEK